jgi:hypothetical protein
MNFSAIANGDHRLTPIRTLHQHTQSVGATGGVYKGQGRNQRRYFQETGSNYVRAAQPLTQRAIMSLPLGSRCDCTSSQGPSLDGGRLYLKQIIFAHLHLVCELHP